MRTDLRSLELLVAVAEHGSIGATVRLMGLALLRRSSRGTVLTAHGTTVADWAREVLAGSDRAAVGRAQSRPAQGTIARIAGTSYGAASRMTPSWGAVGPLTPGP